MSAVKEIFSVNEDELGELSLEMIEPQHNDKIIVVLRELFQDLIDDVERFNILSSIEITNNKKTKTTLRLIDDAITKRFGIKFKHIMSEDNAYSILTAPPKDVNVLIKDNTTIIDNLKDAVLASGKNEYNSKEIDQIDINSFESDDDNLSMAYRYNKAIDELDKHLHSKNVIIDLKKATIKNLPKDYVGFIIANIRAMIVDAKLNASELTAVLLHEIGHAFTHLEYSYRTIKNNSAFIDSMQEMVGKKNMSYKKALLLSYRKVTGEDAKDLKDKNVVEAAVAIMDKYMMKTFYMSDSNTVSKDSEMLADKFSSRFGMGTDLTQALIKVEKYSIKVRNEQTIFNTLNFIFSTSLFTIIVIIFLSIIYIAVLLPYLIFYIIFNYGLKAIIDSVLTQGGEVADVTYDSYKRRLQRIKNEIISQIRTSKLGKNDMVRLLETVTVMDDMLSTIPDDKKSIIDKIFTTLSFSGRKYENTRKIEEISEDLMNNDLHVAGKKLMSI